MEKKLRYFVSDVHLGCDVLNPADREARFVGFLRSLPEETAELYLLGDIWDFWYEYRDVVPRGYFRVFAALTDLIDRGVAVYFFQGNHDVWTFSYFEQIGMKKLVQPYIFEADGKLFCIGHGDGLGPVPKSYLRLRRLFHNRVAQRLFSTIHPHLAFSLGNGWSRRNRLSHKSEYEFKGMSEPLCIFAEQFAEEYKADPRNGGRQIDFFIFGHYHSAVDMYLPCGSRFLMLKDWFKSSPYIVWNGESITASVRL